MPGFHQLLPVAQPGCVEALTASSLAVAEESSSHVMPSWASDGKKHPVP